ncbi:PaaI family thioesterase [Chromobacterium subtsugae]|uniref:PaaI family thioesterase n=1 Tax=Chromobacterium subtsugae TaxID=251747 RepID=A0ABS7FIA6_9NEIS|nr:MULTISPECIES: PaaI family thioesterase [Chromobacterium]KUM03700.1 hypothetical protein Cv017_00830 [Chromobacterium subtsugae]KZE88367.1 hypothetical protein AWB61_00160 [Chromobacterium sp. F49]MBW7568714.1 PaaI family thioesterase [Chromobacterium subtsugae]MBW8289456.1 PaaI family thioesterase [Chromobacterium subtsugae]WSE90002.1 PaaI family thioesterase [Chromobacterium subtsugae]
MKQDAPLLLDVAQAKKILAESPFGPWWNFQVEAVSPGKAILRLPLKPEHYRPGGVAQGGSMMTLADVAFWLALMTVAGVDTPAVTLEMKTNFLRAARTDLSCEAEVMTAGRRILYGTATITDSEGKIVSHHTLTYINA